VRLRAIVESLGDERAFPIRTLAFGGDFLSEEPAAVVFRADAHDMRGRVETVHHPPRPAFGRRAFFNVAVKDGGNPVGAKAFGQTEHPLAVGVGIVAVADEDGDFAHRWSELRLSEDDVFRVFEFFLPTQVAVFLLLDTIRKHKWVGKSVEFFPLHRTNVDWKIVAISNNIKC